jgi:hypothetical protein
LNPILAHCLSIAIKHKDAHAVKAARHFTFILQGRKIVEWSTNRNGPSTTPNYQVYLMTHAEPNAYRKAKGIMNHRKSFYAVNVRLNGQGDLRNSFPCPFCFAYLKGVGAHHVWFSTNMGFAKINL